LHEPPVVFLDEPTSGVDPINRRRFWDLIYDLSARGTTICVSTHYMDEAEYCHRLGLIYRGELIALGSPYELKQGIAGTDGQPPTLEDVFVERIEARRRAEGIEVEAMQ
jgi:ABC-2 type transport system ATP-binding protein